MKTRAFLKHFVRGSISKDQPRIARRAGRAFDFKHSLLALCQSGNINAKVKNDP